MIVSNLKTNEIDQSYQIESIAIRLLLTSMIVNAYACHWRYQLSRLKYLLSSITQL